VIFPWAAGSQIFFNSPTVMSPVILRMNGDCKGIKGNGSSMYLTPPLLQAAISSVRIGREALLMSVSPAQNF